MRNFLQKSYAWLIMLVAMFTISGSAWADEVVTINGASESSKNGVTLSGGSPYASVGGYYISSYELTVSAPSGKQITKIIINDSYSAKASTSVGNYNYTNSTHTWTGNASKVVFTEESTNPWVAQTIKVTLIEGSGGSVDPNPGTGEGGGSTAPAFPVEGVAYQIAHYESVIFPSGGYINVNAGENCTIHSTVPEALYFTWDGSHNGFTIKDTEGNYIGQGAKDWICGSTTEEYWTVEKISEGVYAFKGSKGYLGFNTNTGTAYRNMEKGAYKSESGYYHEYRFTIEEYASPINYIIDLVNAPAGASVRVNDDKDFTADGTYETTDVLTTSNISVTCPESYDYEVDYTESSHTFTITFTALPEYTYAIAVYPQDKADEFKIMIGGVEYGDTGMGDITLHRLLTESDIDAPEQPGYDGPVVEISNLADNYYLIDVTYTALPSLAIGSSATDRDGNYWTSFCYNKPVEFGEGVTPCIVTGTENGKLTVVELEGPASLTTEDKVLNGTHVGSTQGWTNYDRFAINTSDANSPSITTSGFIEADGTDFRMGVSSNNVVFHAPDGYLITSIVPSYNNYEGYCIEWTDIHQVNGNYAGPAASEVNARFYNADGNSWWFVNNFTITIAKKAAPIIPANTAVLLKSDAPSAVTYYTRPSGNVNVSSNILSASGETGFSVSNDADHLYYKLTLNAAGEAGTAAFYWDKNSNEGHSITVPAHKAYLMLPASAGSNRAAYHFSGDETLTGIEALETEADNAPVYNLQGQRVNATKAGVYVKNGKKFIVK